MREVFKDLLAVDGVRGAMFFSPSGERVFEEFNIGGGEPVPAGDWYALAASLGRVREAELVFEKGRLYVRRTAEGVLVVVMGLIAPCAGLPSMARATAAAQPSSGAHTAASASPGRTTAFPCTSLS